MSIVRPFKGLRPTGEKVESFACPPYDVLEDSEVKEIVSKKPESFLKVTRAEVEFPEGTDPHSDEVYKRAGENLKNFEKEGIIFQDETPAYYLYRETWRGQSQTGLFATVSVDEYDKGLIKKHELTRQDKEDDRTRHITLLGAQSGPVFLTFKSKETIKNILSEMLEKYDKEYDLTDENEVRHELWVVNNEEDVKKIQESFSDIEKLYIADGHHRAAAASRTQKLMKEKNSNHVGNEEYNYFLAAIFPHDELRVLDYNRVVKDLNGLSKDEFIEKISENFEITETKETPYSPKELHTYGMYLDKKWYILKPKTVDESDPVKALDVYILQNYLLDPILGIKNPRKDSRIHFLGGIRGIGVLEEWVDNKDWKVAFSMHPTPLEQLIDVADADKVMPPKSTWFEPKLRSGLVIHKI
ncbi:hypothetical protein OSSY52_20300 [Tepiditoga spiralis]|uniref:DUF1015 domain-containing protein n=1 Tax=Tepiditoga spiralis TaxID=2108365 RepID=A0A7G1GC78_9BACT|nr:DUF1015 family protein [Tepiditoga spiralis]BBE31889.1 hypothetical protein OSSY52_20300 [Tepiditoga spiralis]